MIYQIVSPVVQTINGDSLKEAIKNFVKVNDMYSLNKLIVTDQQNAFYNANINYYKNNNKNKVKIDIQKNNTDNVGWTVYPQNEPNYLVSPVIGINSGISPVITTISNNSGINPIVTAPGKISANNNGAVLFPTYNTYSKYPPYPLSTSTLPLVSGAVINNNPTSIIQMPYPV
jgi:hypothetical protein